MQKVLLAVVLAAVVGVSLAQGARRPTSSERSRILAAIKLDLDQFDQKTKSFTGRIALGYGQPRVSTVDRHWAVAPIRIWDASGREAQSELTILRKSNLTGHWLVLDITTDPRECYVPKAVRKDLGLLCG
jgi:hypothetical protein